MKYNIDKNKKRINAMKPKWFEIMLLYVLIIAFAIGYDLTQIFNIELTFTLGWIAIFFLMDFCYLLFWSIDFIIFVIVCKKNKRDDFWEEDFNK